MLTKKPCQRNSNQVECLSKMESSDDRSYLQVHLWRSTSRKMTYPLFLFATFYMSGAVWILARNQTLTSFLVFVIKAPYMQIKMHIIRKLRELGTFCIHILWDIWPSSERFVRAWSALNLINWFGGGFLPPFRAKFAWVLYPLEFLTTNTAVLPAL